MCNIIFCINPFCKYGYENLNEIEYLNKNPQRVRRIIFIKYRRKNTRNEHVKTSRAFTGPAKYIPFKAPGIIDIRESRETLFRDITNVQAERYNTNDRTRTQFGNVRARA